MNPTHKKWNAARAMAALVWIAAPSLPADAVTDWSVRACDIVVQARQGPPPSVRSLAIVQTAVYEAVNAITMRYPADGTSVEAALGASVPAAVAAANRAALAEVAPSQLAAIDAAYQQALAMIPDGPSKRDGIAVGERAAAAVLAERAWDIAASPDTYRPRTSPGVYIPTASPAVPLWPLRKPWLMTSPAQFRPGPPPALASDTWARDFNEIKTLGHRNSPARSPEQTAIARFWEETQPTIYHGIIHSIADREGREATQNARLFAAAAQAMDDAIIAVFDAKYFYNFWRPLTAIRNGDIDGNPATERDASWTPFIDTPMHPEYPCAHCVVSGAVAEVLRAEIGDAPTPVLTTTSSTAPGAARSWTSLDDFTREVAEARIFDGVHFRTSTEVGTAMGRRVGALAAAKYLRSSE